MGSSDKKLDELFAGLRADAPEVMPNELDALIEQNAVIPVSDPFEQTTKRKRKIIMTTGIIVALITIAAYFSSTDTAKQVASSSENKVIIVPSASIQSQSLTIHGSETPILPVAEKDTFKILSYSKATVALPSVIVPTDAELTSLGIRREDDGAIILDEDYTSQIEFAIDTFARFAPHDSRQSRIPYELFPQFVTDIKGNLIMIGEHKLDKNNSRSSNLSLIADMPSSLPKLQYYRTTTMSAWGGVVDSEVSPPLYTVHWKLGVGIMSLDTIVRFSYGYEREEAAIRHSIIERLAAADSLCKLKYGGENGLNPTFGNALSGSEMSGVEKRVLKSIDSIGRTESSDLEKAEAQFGFINELKTNMQYTEIERLKFERLSRGYDYKLYLLRHAEDEKKFSQINSYVPVLVRNASGSLPNKQYDNGLIFWYKPSQEFSQAIPKKWDEPLSVATVNTSIEVSAYPNPAIFYLFVNYKLASGSKATIELRNLLGHTVLGPTQHASASGNIQLDVSHLASGMYLLVVSNDLGQQQIQRIIVQKP